MSKELVRSFVATFGAVFLAELGDKTQLATMAMAGTAGSARGRWLVFLAAATALVATSALGVLGGAVIGRYVRAQTIERLAGALFIVLGVLMLVRAK
ncbi:MAG: TMEM165/GDT1 family protein [Deltaproteobacteria bacterium]|nr:TMEM165/GDT1 family protein [Deltaproteobacteria bacterium]